MINHFLYFQLHHQTVIYIYEFVCLFCGLKVCSGGNSVCYILHLTHVFKLPISIVFRLNQFRMVLVENHLCNYL